MKRYIVKRLDTGLYLGNKGTVTQEKARIFSSAGAAKQAAKWWGKWPIDIEEVQMVVVGASTVPSTAGIAAIPFKMVVDYFREIYFTDITKNIDFGERTSIFYNIPILPHLIEHNRFLRGIGNGSFLVVKMTDFKTAHPFIMPHVKEMLEIFGVDDEEKFCLFEIDWEDEHGNIKEGY